MNKVILICGNICVGKTTYAKNIAKEINAIILSIDEITLLFGQHLGEKHSEIVERTKKYLYKKSLEILSNGISVILDWGFWTYEERKFVTKYFTDLKINVEWHYVEVDDITWKEYLEKRNNAVENNEEESYFIDSNILNKSLDIFEEPKQSEMDVWHRNHKK
jgi:predicted kinase